MSEQSAEGDLRIWVDSDNVMHDSVSGAHVPIEMGTWYHVSLTPDGMTVQTGREAWDAAVKGRPWRRWRRRP